MNLLAHAVLSGPEEHIQLGNFVGDFVKGDPAHPRHNLPSYWLKGVRLHRHIDSFTDEHAVSRDLRGVLRPYCHKYAGVALDVIYDHFLALEFENWYQKPLATFVNGFYKTLEANSSHLPYEARHLATHLVRGNWLLHYQTLEGVSRSLTGMARRTAFPSNLERAPDCLTANYAIFADGFKTFFPSIQESCRFWLQERRGEATD